MKPHNFILPGFAITSVGLVLIFWWLPEWAVWVSSPWVGWLGALAVAVVFGWRGWLASQRAYDLLLWGSLWLWLAGWLPIFSAEAPMFKAYPVYFVLLDALTGHFVLGHRARWNIEEQRMLASLAKSGGSIAAFWQGWSWSAWYCPGIIWLIL